MLYILPAVKMRENRAEPPRKSLTPGDGELMPPAILSGHMDKKPQKPAGSFHRAARPVPSAATETSREALIGAKKTTIGSHNCDIKSLFRVEHIDSNLLFI